MPTLISYNTSYVTDCHSSQFNNFMSESSSILKKAIEVYNANHPNEKINLNYESESDEKLKSDIANLKSDKDIGDNLDVLRRNMAKASTTFLKTFVENKQPEFIALIEQSIHVGSDNHAYYDAFMGNKFDLSSFTPPISNQDYGILKRKSELNFDDLDQGEKTGSNYFIVYDNVVNKSAKNAEGISIAFHKDLFDVQMKWDPSKHPSRKELLEDADSASTLNNKQVSYFSADLGPIVCYVDPNAKNKVIRYATGRDDTSKTPIIDAGRPIIMTGGISTTDNILKVLVAIHGPNIPNLFPVKDNVRGDKPLKLLLDDDNERANAFNMFSQVRKSIGDFIQNGLNELSEDVKNKIKENTKVEIYLGGDLNDPRGIILESFIKDGIELTLPTVNKKVTVSFNRYKLRPDPINIKNASVSQFRYKNLKTCCANADSITEEAKRDATAVANGQFDIAHLFKLRKYPAEFHKPENFGYNGDYALYGCSESKDGFEKMETGLEERNASELIWKGIYASDHLPIISSSGFNLGGKKSRRRNKKNRKSVRKYRNKK